MELIIGGAEKKTHLTEQFRNEDTDACNVVSTASISLVNLFNNRPVGCESKNDIGSRKTVDKRDCCKDFAAVRDPRTTTIDLII